MPAFGIIKVPIRIRLKIKIERMKVHGHIGVIAKVLIKIRFPVSVPVMQSHDSVFAGYVDSVAHHLEPERFIKPRRETLPF